jgi:Fe-S cluster assembly protein SufD
VDIETLTLKGLDQDAVRAWSRALGDPDWFLARRLEALAALGKLERPTNREEAWRFTDPKRAGLDRHAILSSGGRTAAEGARVLAAGHADAASGGDVAGTELEPAGLVATVDGAGAETFLDPALAAEGVILTDLPTALREHAGLVETRFMTSAAPYDEDWFSALHATLVTAGAFLYVPRGVEVTVPIGVLQRRTVAGATFAHTLVVVEPEASLTLVQQHGSPETLNGRAFHHGVTELLIGERASVQYLSLQEWGSEQVNHFAVQRSGARQGSGRSWSPWAAGSSGCRPRSCWARAPRPTCSGPCSPTPASGSSTGPSSPTPSRTPAPASSTRPACWAGRATSSTAT